MTKEKATSLAEELARRFTARVKIEDATGGRFWFEITPSNCRGVPFLPRREQAWEPVNQLLKREEKDDISPLLTIGPEDVDASLFELMQ